MSKPSDIKGYTPPTFHTERQEGEVSLGLGRANVLIPPQAKRCKDMGYLPFIANVEGTDDYVAQVLHRQGTKDKPYIEIVPLVDDPDEQRQLIWDALNENMAKAKIR